MPNLALAAFVVFSTLVLVAGIVLGYFAIRRRLLADPDLQEFVERVEAGRAAEGNDLAASETEITGREAEEISSSRD